jgi:hypothetical protein
MNVDGKSVVQSDQQLQAYRFKSVPNYEHTLVWVNPTTPDLREEQRFDRYPDSVVPGPGGTSLHFVTFPPSSVFADPSFDGQAARSEALIRLRGLADHFEEEDPAMHKTNTVDYAVVYEGEIWLELDDAKTIHLKRGDVVVQNGSRHVAKQRHNTGDHVVLSKRRERVTRRGCRNDLGRQFQISAVGAAPTSFRCPARGAHLAAERDRPDLTVRGLARESGRSIPLRSRKRGVR